MDELFTFVRDGVRARKGQLRRLADEAGVSYSWITKLHAGKYDETNVGHRTLERVAAVLRRAQPQ